MGKMNSIKQSKNAVVKQSKKANKIDTNAKNRTMPVKTILACMWVISVAVRFALALNFRHGPSVVVDESLYTNIARSLAAGEGIAYRSQPVPYLYIFYPLLLTPIYLMPIQIDFYRAVQLWNAMLMSTAVIPSYLLGKDLTGDDRKALLCGAGTLLMPDMCMAGYLMSECVVWPLSLLMMWTAWRMIGQEDHKVRYGIWTGVLSALLFWTKPGTMAMGASILVAMLIWSIVKKDKEMTKSAGAGACVMAGLILCFYLLYIFGFGYQMSVLGLYDKQLTETSLGWYAAVAETSVLQILLFAIGCAGFCFVLPYVYYKHYDEKQKQFLMMFSIGLMVTAIGTAALVVMYKWNGSYTNMKLHLRYMAMYIPVMMAFTAAIPEKKIVGKSAVIALVVMALLIIFPGAGVGSVPIASTAIDSMTLSAWLQNGMLDKGVGIVLTAFTVVFILFITSEIGRNGLDKNLRRFCAIFMGFFLLYNNICAVINGNWEVDPDALSDAREANLMLEESEEPVLGIGPQHYHDIRLFYEESQLRKPMQITTIENLLFELQRNGGIYKAYVPLDQSPNEGNHSTPETGTFLLGPSVREHVEVNPKAEIHTTAHGFYSMVRVPEGERLIDTAFYGLDCDTLKAEDTAYLRFYDPERDRRTGTETIRFTALANQNGAILKIRREAKTQEIELTTSAAEYEVQLAGAGEITFTADDSELYILSYKTVSDN